MNRQGPNGIRWCHLTWNPLTGCMNGCSYCFARQLAGRFPAIHGQEWTTPKFHPERLSKKELRQPKDGERVFVCSMGDIFSEGVKPEWVEAVFDAIRTRPNVHFQMLTKLPEGYDQYNLPVNLWLGTSIDTYETQADRARRMHWVPYFGVKWINAAPALSAPDDNLIGFFKPDWIVTEPLTGSNRDKRRESEAHVLHWYCWAKKHGIPCWVKGMKKWPFGTSLPEELPSLHRGKCSA